MYFCSECAFEFEKPERIFEAQGFSSPPFEEILVCPCCKSTKFFEQTATHCRCCGAKLPDGCEEYCSSECYKIGMLLWKKQVRRRKVQNENLLYAIIKEIADYNRINKTDYSYGQYVAFIENKRSKGKCRRKKKNT